MMLLSNMRYLPRTMNPKAMSARLRQLISVVPSDFQPELIAYIPSLCIQTEQSEMAAFLRYANRTYVL